MPITALEAMHQSQLEIQQLGPFSNAVNGWIDQETSQTRQVMAAELGVAPETLALTENVSIGCNIVLWGIDWQVGDQILLSDCEHPSVMGTVQELQRRYQLKVVTFPLSQIWQTGDPLALLAAALSPKTRLVVLSHVLWNSGQALPLAEMVSLCHQQSPTVQVLVDAAQSVGLMPLDLTAIGVDFYAFTGHKWWCGPAGLGGLYVHPQADLHPTFIGWRGIKVNAQGQPIAQKTTAQRFEVATSNFALGAGLRAAIACHARWGTVQQRYDRLCTLAQSLWKRLAECPGITCVASAPPRSGLVSFQLTHHPDAHGKLVQFLEQQSILVRTLLNPNCVRACLHYFTLEAEIDRLMEQIQQFLADPSF